MTQKVDTAVVLAAGKGKRLDVFETPKPLLKIGGKSLIVHTLDNLKKAGIKNVFIVIRKGDFVQKRELIDYPLNIEFIEQTSGRRGMLDSMLSLEGKIDKPFYVTVSDLILSHNPYKMFVDCGVAGSADTGALVCFDSRQNKESGANTKVLARDGVIREISSRLPSYNALDLGIYYFSPKAHKSICALAKKDKTISSVPQFFVVYSQKEKIRSVEYSGDAWFDVNIPKTFIRAELYLGEENSAESGESKKERTSLKNLPKTVLLHNKKETVTDITVKRNILERLDEYEVIPSESYNSPHHIIVDESIDSFLGKPILDKLLSLGYKVYKHTVKAGENAKSINSYVKLSEEILNKGIDKKSTIISIGGGSVKDMGGFLASTLYRGIGFISIPTTILSQADAAIALKQGVNGGDGKNLIGSWYAPLKIIVDPATILKLDERWVSDGLAECIKQGFAYDKKLYNLLKGYKGDMKDLDFLESVLKLAIEDKVRTIEEDLHEDKIALVNQYGHEFGHAVEHLSGYAYGHGESVAIGMRVSAELSYILGICDRGVVDAHIELLEKYNLPHQVPKVISPEDILNSLKYNKKYYSGEPRFVLVDKIGSVWRDKTYYTVNCRDEFIKQAVEASYN
ncbi:MAG: iron-containing alcohol dehydrogenase [Candidatus Pacebacteria bacterium]|jgi:3-dehydroquinate synthase|nr:hypothetical protein [bacterium]MDP6527887.1 iron-containing alcohol dehydrogenase [Candidatus Paceibacterota bacterium]MDP6659697.1 iron-containing alcohol dehydrogenase [Candidatus Paceibacterota bacterium]|tara:strand:- start:30546 stop:32420 length:1875 start_codon:yes stop_codon:yes gene_type:complete